MLPRRHDLVSVARRITIAALGFILAAPGVASAQKGEARWAPIRELFGQGESEDGYFRVNLPRTDLHVSVGRDALDPDFEFRGYFGFAPMGARAVMAMGEMVLLDSEVPAVLAEARRQHVQVTALHNHLLGETPRIVYVHVLADGAPRDVATRLRATVARSGTPLTPPADEPARGDWSAVDAILGPHAEASGRIAEYEFPRHEALHVHGRAVKSSGVIETASEVVFQSLDGRRVAGTGELYLLPREVEPVVTALEANGLHVTAIHTHMLDDGPAHFWVHWYATGDEETLTRGVAAALSKTNGATRSKAAKK